MPKLMRSNNKSKRSSLKLILVDPQDRKIGEIDKLICHQYGMLHRAFSILIFRKREKQWELLLQKRSKKNTMPGAYGLILAAAIPTLAKLYTISKK